MYGWRRWRARAQEILRAPRRLIEPPDMRVLRRRVRHLEEEIGRLLVRECPGIEAGSSQRDRMRRREARCYSQNGEDGLLLEILSEVGVQFHSLVEIGCGSGEESIGATLVVQFGWRGLLADRNAQQVRKARRFFHEKHGVSLDRVSVESETVQPDSVDQWLSECGFSGAVDVLAIDIDGNDYWLWKAIAAIDPRIVVIEYNASLGPEEKLSVPFSPDHDPYRHHPRGWHHGASLAALEELGKSLGYSLVACDSMGVNAFFLRRDLLTEKIGELTCKEAFFSQPKRLKRASQRHQEEIMSQLPFEAVEAPASQLDGAR